MYFGFENADGSIPDDPVLFYFRNTSDSLNGTTESISSSELLKGRSNAAPRPGNSSSSGDVSFEFAPGSFDKLIEAALMSPGWTVDPNDPTGNTSYLLPGNIKRRMFVLKKFTEPDRPLYQLFRGVQANTFTLTFAVNAIATGTFSLMGVDDPKLFTENPLGDVPLPPLGFTESFTTREGFLTIDGTQIRYANNFEISLNNNLTALNTLFEKEAYEIKEKKLDLTGTLGAYFVDEILHNKRVNDEDTNFVLEIADRADTEPNRVLYRFFINSAKLTESDTGAGGADEINPSYPWTAFGENVVRVERVLPANNSVNFNGNGSTGGTVPDTLTGLRLGDEITIPGPGDLVNGDDAFAGWSTAAPSGNTLYQEGDVLVVSGNMTLYAQWGVRYAVTYNGNGADGGTVPASVTGIAPGTQVNASGNTGDLTLALHRFTGWNTRADGQGASYAPAAPITVNSDITLYAQWAENLTVTYHGNGETTGEAPAEVNDIVPGTIINAAANTGNLAKTGFAFAGWNTEPGGGGQDYNVSASITVNVDMDLYAKWVDGKTVTYHDNLADSGTAPAPVVDILPGTVINASANTGDLERDGYAFTGWSTEPLGAGTTYEVNDPITVNDDIDLYPIWVETFTVHFDGNEEESGTPPADITDVVSGSQVAAPDNTGSLEWTGYNFTGWNTNADGVSGTHYDVSDMITVNSDLDLYADWESE